MKYLCFSYFLFLITFPRWVFKVESVKDRETSSKCNKNSNELFRNNYFIQKWMDARMEVGMNNVATTELHDRKLSKIIRFNQYVSRSGVILYNTTDGLMIPYARILKCGSEGISRNLHLIGSKRDLNKGLIKSTTKSEIKTQNKFNEIFKSYKDSNKAIPLIFTFVRDPFEHFLSGFSESVYNHFLNYQQTVKQNNNILINSTFVKDILHQFLDFNSPYEFGPLNGFEHMFPMAGILFEFNIKIIGHLESFQYDWNNIIMPQYNISKKFISKLGQHPTSKTKGNHNYTDNNNINSGDPNNARKSLIELIDINVQYKRAICHLILIDYICLPMYTLPSECQFLNKTKELYQQKLISLY